jgi:hypothetical protein
MFIFLQFTGCFALSAASICQSTHLCSVFTNHNTGEHYPTGTAMYSIRPAAAAAAATFRHSPAVCADSGGGGRTAVGGLAQPRSAAATTAKSLRAGDPTDDRKVFIQVYLRTHSNV